LNWLTGAKSSFRSMQGQPARPNEEWFGSINLVRLNFRNGPVVLLPAYYYYY